MEGTMHEADPIMRPFANSSAMYAAVQVAPVLFDLMSKQMLRNSHSWVRKSWWVPQSASTVASILSGAHNAIVPRLMELLREKEMTDVLVVAGGIIPDDDAAELKKLGVAEIFQPGASLEKITRFIRESVRQVSLS